MMMSKNVKLTTLVLGLVPVTVHGFDRDAHEAVGMTAMSAIEQGTTLTTLKRLLRNKDAMDVSDWAHLVDKRHPWAQTFHFQRYKLPPVAEGQDPSTEPDDAYLQRCDKLELVMDETSCAGNHCLTRMIQHFFASVTTQEGAAERIKVDPFPEKTQFTDADAIKFIVNLVADLHSPVHYVPIEEATSSEYGNPAGTVRSNDKAYPAEVFTKVPSEFAKHVVVEKAGTDTTSLQSVWDGGLEKYVRSLNPSFWDGGWTSISRGGHIVRGFNPQSLFDEERVKLHSAGSGSSMVAEGVKLIELWAWENARFACKNAYRDPVARKRISRGTQEAPGAKLTKDWLEDLQEELFKKILMSGARVALLLNAIVESTLAGQNTAGSSVPNPSAGATAGVATKTLSGGTALSDVKDLIDEESELRDEDASSWADGLPDKLVSAKAAGKKGGNWTKEEMLANFATNLFIFGVELVCLLAWLRYTTPKSYKSSAAASTVNSLNSTGDVYSKGM